MSLIRFYPLANANSLNGQLNRIFDELTTDDYNQTKTFKLPIELIDCKDKLTLRVIAPGINKEDFDISVTRESVKISVDYNHDQSQKDKGHYISEFNYGKFERLINLPVAIQNNQVEANYVDGILTLNLPKVELAKNKVFKVNLEDATKPSLEAKS